jgi:hypothetical protein
MSSQVISGVGSEPLANLIQSMTATRDSHRQEIMKAQAEFKARTQSGPDAISSAHEQSLSALHGIVPGRAIPAFQMRSDSSSLIKSVLTDLNSANSGLKATSLPTLAELDSSAPFSHADERDDSNETLIIVRPQDVPRQRDPLHHNLVIDPSFDPLNGLQFDSLSQLQEYVARVSLTDISSATLHVGHAKSSSLLQATAAIEAEDIVEQLPCGTLAGRMHAAPGDVPSSEAMVDNFTSEADSESDEGGAGSAQEDNTYTPWASSTLVMAQPPAVPFASATTHHWVMPQSLGVATGAPALPTAAATATESDCDEADEEVQILSADGLGSSSHGTAAE